VTFSHRCSKKLGAVTGNKIKEPLLKNDFAGGDINSKISVEIENARAAKILRHG
jgi:hypothetical protein